jgi:excisionase family DNA binding protein
MHIQIENDEELLETLFPRIMEKKAIEIHKNKFLSFSILCLSISIVVSAFIIANAMKNTGDNISGGLASISGGINNIAGTVNNTNNRNLTYSRNTLTLSTAATYLGINELRLKEIIENKDSGIPYIKLGESYILSKDALDKWMETARFESK